MERGVIPSDRWPQALALLFAQEPAENRPALVEQGLGRLRTRAAEAEGLIGVWDAHQVHVCLWLVRGSDQSVNLGSPGCRDFSHRSFEEWSRDLWDLAIAWQQRHDTRWSQALWTPTDTGHWRDEIINAGYVHAACLKYLHRAGQTPPAATEPLPEDWQWCLATDLSRENVLELVEETFRETLDCPFLGEHRSIAEIVAGFRATGDTEDRHWHVLTQSGRPVGCVLGSIHQETSLLEWTYVGLVPLARGQGRGNWLCQRGIQLANETGCADIALAVDGANVPALKLYARHAFRTWDARDVFVKWSWNQT